MFSGVHAKAASTTTKSIALGAKLAGVAYLAEKLPLVLGAVGGVEQLVTQSTLEAHFVPFQPTSYSLFSSIYRLAALRALWVLNRLERHFAGRVSLT